MAMSTDSIIDRRRLRRKVTFWRIMAVLAAVLAIVAWAFASGGIDGAFGRRQPQIAKIRVEGTITQDQDLIDRLHRLAKTDSVKAVILAVNSPGGTTVGGESIYEAVRELAARKPVVAEVGTVAASAAYMIACGADHIVAQRTSIVGSIGVLFEYPDLSGLLDKAGVKVEDIKSSPLKAEPNYFHPASEEAKTMIRSMILDSYAWFVDLVQTRRGFTHDQALALSDGSVFTGRQALGNRLVDAVGGESAALEWLRSKGIDIRLPVVEWKRKEDVGRYFFAKAALHYAAGLLGLPAGSGPFLRELTADRIFLDGLVSVWQVGGGRGGDK